MGRARLGDLGFDIVHINVHKTFSTPHGGGGPGAGPVCVKERLAEFLPTPHVEQRDDGLYHLAAPAQSVGRIGSAAGNVGVLLRAYTYFRMHGAEGLKEVSGAAVLNANYLRARLSERYHLPYDRVCMHEAVFSATRQRRGNDVRAGDICKRLLDHGFYAPTVYFPLIVEEALMNRANGDGKSRDPGCIHRGNDLNRPGGHRQPGPGARRPPHHPRPPHR